MVISHDWIRCCRCVLPFLVAVGVFVGPSLLATNLRQQVKGLWDAADYEKLDALYAELAEEEFEIWNGYPDLLQFFDILSPYSRQDDGWDEAIAGVEAWRAERPGSIAAVLALAKVYERWAWNARGSGYTHTVSDEGWKLFDERRTKALELLMATEPNVQDELYRLYLFADILYPSGKYYSTAREACDNINVLYPTFLPAYQLTLRYLLPRWHGTDALLMEYIAQVSDRLGGDDSDILYAELMDRVATNEPDGFSARFLPDSGRIYRGLTATIERQAERYHPEYYASLAKSMMVSGDVFRARQAFLDSGPSASFRAWSFKCEQYQNALALSGAGSDLAAAWRLEREGDLSAAEESYRELVSDGVENRWLRGYYLRHARPEFFDCALDELDPNAEPDRNMGAYDLAALCLIFTLMEDYDRAEAYSAVLEKKGRFALYAWIARYHQALFESDPVAANAAREAICSMKISRPSHAAAQAFVCADSEDIPDIQWIKFADFTATSLIALRLLELERYQAAVEVLEKAIPLARGDYERDRMAVLLRRADRALMAQSER